MTTSPRGATEVVDLALLEPNNPHIPPNVYFQTPLTTEGVLFYNIGVMDK